MTGIVDAHLHVWDETAAGKDPGPMRMSYSPQSPAPLELLRDYMEEAGVDRAVFVQPWFHHWDNAYIAAARQCDPDRFRAVCVIDPRGPAAPKALAEWRARGVTGIRLRPFRAGEGPAGEPHLGGADTLSLWEAIAKTGTIVCLLHQDTALRELPALLRRFPSVPVVIDHLNNPVPAEGLDQPRFRAVLELAALPTVYLKVSGFHHWCRERYPYRDGMPFIAAAIQAFGPERCMWGSDFPHVLAGCGYIRNRNFLAREAKLLSPETLALVMRGTAERLWFG